MKLRNQGFHTIQKKNCEDVRIEWMKVSINEECQLSYEEDQTGLLSTYLFQNTFSLDRA